MKRTILLIYTIMAVILAHASMTTNGIYVTEKNEKGTFPLSGAAIYTDNADYKVVGIAAAMLADDIERVTGTKPQLSTASSLKKVQGKAAVVAGTIGNSRIIDELARKGLIDVSPVKGKWESYIISTINLPKQSGQLLVVAGSDRRATAFGLTTLSESIGVSPWYWWADVTPKHKDALFIAPVALIQKEPAVQYRGIFINDERFGGWY